MPLELPSWRGEPDDASRTLLAIDAWAGSASLESLVRLFGGTVAGLRGDELLAELERFASRNWDFRGGRERNLAVEVALSDAQSRGIRATAVELGLAGRHTPSRPSYDAIVMTGGMVRAGLVKPRFAAQLLAGGLSTRSVVFLGGFRPFAGDEPTLAELLGVHGRGEFDAMVAGVRRAFGPLGAAHIAGEGEPNEFASWTERSWELGSVRLSVVAAPSSEPLVRRANTADTYRFWAEHLRRPGEQSVLLVTTPVYVPYQAAVAVQVFGLGYGLAVETVGVDDAASDLGEHSQVFTGAHHLQELRAAIGAMRFLRSRLAREG